MQETNLHSNLLSDVTSLYVMTGRDDLLDLVRKIAYTQTHRTFMSWLSNPNSIKNIKNKLNDVKILDAFDYLRKLSSTYPAGLSQAEATNILVSSLTKGDKSTSSGIDPKMAVALPYIVMFRDLMAEPEFGAILEPFKNILSAFTSGTLPKENMTVIRDQAIADLRTIWQGYQSEADTEEMAIETRRESRGQKIFHMKKEMFSALLRRMSNEIADHLREAQHINLADAFQNGGLVNPALLSKYTSVYTSIMRDPKAPTYAASKKVAQEVLKRYGDQYEDDNYNYIKASVLEPEGYVPMADPYSTHSRDSSLLDEIMGKERANIKSVIERTDLFLKPNVLTRLCLVFKIMYEEIIELGKKY